MVDGLARGMVRRVMHRYMHLVTVRDEGPDASDLGFVVLAHREAGLVSTIDECGSVVRRLAHRTFHVPTQSLELPGNVCERDGTSAGNGYGRASQSADQGIWLECVRYISFDEVRLCRRETVVEANIAGEHREFLIVDLCITFASTPTEKRYDGLRDSLFVLR